MSKPTIRELLDKIGSFNNGSPSFVLAERVEKVLKFHRCAMWNRYKGDDAASCRACNEAWPCATVRTLDGE